MKQKHYISFISMRLCHLTNDQITVALIFIEDGKVSVTISENKLKLVRKICPKNVFKLFKFALDQFKKNESTLTLADIERLHIYHNGILKVHKPNPIALENVQDKENFVDNYFNKRIDSYFTTEEEK